MRVTIIILLGFVLRLLCAHYSIGSNDIRNWETFSHAQNFCALFSLKFYNNPPLAGLWAFGANFLAQFLNIKYSLAFKIPGLIAESVTGALLYSLLKNTSTRRATAVLAIYSCSPIAILISGYHGNTDAICIALICLSFFLVEKLKPPYWAGLALGAALNIKLIPILFLAPLAASLPTARKRLGFLIGAAVGLIPFALTAASCGMQALKSVFEYGSNPEYWGILAVLAVGFHNISILAQSLLDIGMTYHLNGKWFVLGLDFGLTFFVYWKMQLQSWKVAAIVSAGFLIVAPGFGIQYLAYPLPFILVFFPMLGGLYAVLSGIYAGLIYYHFWLGAWPFASQHVGPIPDMFTPVGLLVWLILITIEILLFKKKTLILKSQV